MPAPIRRPAASAPAAENYLVPVDARLERDVDVRYETVTLDD